MCVCVCVQRNIYGWVVSGVFIRVHMFVLSVLHTHTHTHTHYIYIFIYIYIYI